MSHINERTWTTESGLRATCLLLSLGNRSHRCGYVEVSAGHPLHGVDYQAECDALRGQHENTIDNPVGGKPSPEYVFDVHGGITYSGKNDNYPLDGQTDGWWFGFDCNHSGDEAGRPLRYVVSECERLAKQLADVKEIDPEAAKIRAEELRPDREKLEQLADAVAELHRPQLSPAAEVAGMEVAKLLYDCEQSIFDIAKGLS